jgi:hypothetical protein
VRVEHRDVLAKVGAVEFTGYDREEVDEAGWWPSHRGRSATTDRSPRSTRSRRREAVRW